MSKLFRALGGNCRGATAVEYGLILSLVVIACIGAFTSMAASTTGMWNNVAQSVNRS